jgi:hypothetical protein
MHPLITTFVANELIDERVTRAARARRFTIRRPLSRRAARRAAAPATAPGRLRPSGAGR